MNEISAIFDIFCIFLLSIVLNFKPNYNVERPHSSKPINVPMPVQHAAYNSCTGESTNGGPVACEGLRAMKVVTCCYSINLPNVCKRVLNSATYVATHE